MGAQLFVYGIMNACIKLFNVVLGKACFKLISVLYADAFILTCDLVFVIIRDFAGKKICKITGLVHHFHLMLFSVLRNDRNTFRPRLKGLEQYAFSCRMRP